jgi:hypothetical protein
MAFCRNSWQTGADDLNDDLVDQGLKRRFLTRHLQGTQILPGSALASS